MPDLIRVSWEVSATDIGDILGGMKDAKSILETFGQVAQVHHNPGCCGPCRANNNPALVPFPDCEGKKKAERGKRIEAAKAKREHRAPKPKVVTGCRCTVIFVDA